MAIDASKTALTYCYNAAPAIKCVHTRYAVIKYRLIDDDEGKRERVDRIWDKRKMRKKKTEKRNEKMASSGERVRRAYAKRGGKENPKSENIAKDEVLSRSLRRVSIGSVRNTERSLDNLLSELR